MKEKNKLLLILICCAAVLFAVLSFFIFNRLRVERNEIIENAKILGEIEKKITDGKDNARVFQDLKEEKEEIEKIIIVNQENLAVFIEYLESLASISFIDMSFESIQEPQDKENYNFVLNIKAKGFFDNIYHFLSMLENIPYLISMDNLTLVKKDSGEKEIKNIKSEWEIKMNLKILNKPR